MKSTTIALVSGLSTLALSIFAESSTAQVIPDGTVGSIVSPTNVITGGTRSGNNLFHSFSQFSIPTNGSAFFNNATDVQNILSRVTGTSQSSIDGLIRSQGNANLFLMNPNGIVFGPNARLQIGGSFVGTTANSIKFSDGIQFSASDTTLNPLLTVNVPIGLQMGGNAGSIQIQGTPPPNLASGLQVNPGQTLALVGGQLDAVGANVVAPDGRIELWALQNGEITINNPTGWQLNPASNPSVMWGNLSLKQSSSIDAGGIDGGAINIRGKSLTVEDGSNISSTTSAGQGKGITIQTTEFVDLLGNSAPGQLFFAGINTSVGPQFTFFSQPGPPTTGRAGNINIETPRLKLANGTAVRSGTSGNNSTAGDVTVRAVEVEMIGFRTMAPDFLNSTITSLITDGTNNTSGKVSVTAQRIRMLEGSRIASSILGGNGVGGSVSIQAQESLEIRGTNSYGVTSAVLATIEAGATGQAGQISIDTNNLILANGGTITSQLAGDTIFFSTSPGAQGTAGNITIRARDIQVSDPLVDSYSGGISGITTALGQGAVGTGGTINLIADRLRVFNGGQITSSSLGQGPAGSVNFQVGNVDVQGVSSSAINGALLPSAITASSASGSAAGSVNIVADRLQVRDGGQIVVSNTGTGDAGNLNVQARSIFLNNGASLKAEVNGGSQGNIQLNTSEWLLLRRESNITTTAQGFSTGGNIGISSPSIIGLENSDIVANAVQGRGGNIQINTQSIFGLKYRPNLTPENDITASSEFGVNGTVQINSFGLDPSSGLVKLNSDIVDSSRSISKGCSANQGNSFVSTGRGGIPQNPANKRAIDRSWHDLRTPIASQSTPIVVSKIQNPESKIVEASRIQINADGSIALMDGNPIELANGATCSGMSIQ